jgi:hypothetical protein
MNFLHSFNNAVDNFFDYIDPIQCYTMSPDYAAHIIQRAYRKHLIRKYFKHLKHCIPPTKESEVQVQIKRGWFS